MAYTQEQKKAHILELQKYLNAVSYYHPEIPCVLPTGIYDEKTETAVRVFQKRYRLTETGETNQATWDKIVSVYLSDQKSKPQPLEAFPVRKNTILRMGDACFTVAVIQTVLMELSKKYSNLPCISVTGNYDADTVRAVQLFQNMCALPVTGETDCHTWNMLAQAGCDLR
ncbi:MAG: peptidoglycan-binding protein [Oscillospiraceae bacterium]|nr:peptidoglycan-binding protein [Oscillospiraceae bacterium]